MSDSTDIRADLIAALDDAAYALRRLDRRGAETTASDEALTAMREGIRDVAPEPVAETPTATPSTPMPEESPQVADPSPTTIPIMTLDEIRADLGDCTRCKLHTGRKQIVFGVGNPNADLMFIGEGPGADEDEQGEPFVGRAGQLLTKMILAMGVRREDVYIANVVKCRPPGNRNPESDEVEACEPFLRKQIASVQPKVICTLGNYATQTLLRTQAGVSKLRGTFRVYQNTPVMPTFHPAYLLRSPNKKREAWEDLQAIMAKLGWDVPSKKD